MDATSNDRRCPLCLEGVLSDLSFDAGGRGQDLLQSPDSNELLQYSCGHAVLGPPLKEADQTELDVERRSADDATLPLTDDTDGTDHGIG
jgi:hypothetical protein